LWTTTSRTFSFININDPDIREVVENELKKGKLWPEPLIQFNPAFETYGEITELVTEGFLAGALSNVFHDEKSGSPYKLYKHQVDAIKLGTAGRNFIVTSGTGSGETLTFIGTIIMSWRNARSHRPALSSRCLPSCWIGSMNTARRCRPIPHR
jgi:ATP-dependent helicase YprA (DUF1998 family)